MNKLAVTACFIFLSLHALTTEAKAQLAIGQDVYEKMQEAQLLVEQKNFNQATAVLNGILEMKRLNNFEKAQTWSMHGNVYFHMERFDLALEAFRNVLSFDELPEGFHQISLRTATQLAFMQDRYDEALQYANKLIAVSEVPDGENYMLLSQIYYKKEDIDSALKNGLRAIELERANGRKIKENWLLVMNAIYYSKNDLVKMAEILRELIALYPKETYIKNLAAIYGQSEQTQKQLVLMEPLYDQGKLKNESELVNLAQLFLLHKVPYKGAVLIEKALEEGKVERSIRNLELLAQAWQLAAEEDRSVQYLVEAAKLEKNAKMYVRVAQAYINLYRWSEAEKALEDALNAGGLENEGETYILLGMVRFYQNNFDDAHKAFKLAARGEKTADLSRQWTRYVDQEKAKYEAARLIQ